MFPMAPRASTLQAEALRALADQVDESGEPLPPEQANAILDALEDREDVAAVRAWRAAQKRGEKATPAADVYRKLKL